MADAPSTAAVGAVADLYLGNILFAIERCAMALDEESRAEEAAFYRGIGRKLAEARATDRSTATPGDHGTRHAPGPGATRPDR